MTPDNERNTQTTVQATCNDAPFCRWTYNGPRSYIEADAHTRRAGHTTVVSEEIRTVFEGRDAR